MSATFGMEFPEPIRDPRGGPLSFLLDAIRRRPVGRTVLTGLTTLLLVAGIGLFIYPFLTDVYAVEVTQRNLNDVFQEYSVTVETQDDFAAAVREAGPGAPLTRIVIDRIGLETLVVEGTSPAALRAGAGHYPNTPLPGQAGNVAIAGHRTTYGKPFNRLDEVRLGDDIWLSTPAGDHRYAVAPAPEGWTGNPFITSPSNWGVVTETSGSMLTLTTCHPKGSARQRLIVRAELVESFPAGHLASIRAAAAAG